MDTIPTPAPSNPVIRRIHTAMLIIGVSGAGKTTLLATFAEYLWETYRSILLLYSCDGGAIPTAVQKRQHQGLLRFWRMQTRSAPGYGIETLTLASKGYWPKVINPTTGETSPAVELVAPLAETYEVRCAGGHWIKTVPTAKLATPGFCQTCKTLPSSTEIKVTAQVRRARGFENVGGVAFDSATSMGQIVLHEMDYMRGHGLIGGEKPAFGGAVQSGGVKFGGNNRADIGFAQTRLDQFVRNSLSIPGLKEGPVWTGLTTEATDEGGLSVVGLKLPGQATTDASPAWFGSVSEAATLVDDQGQPHNCLYLRAFIDPQGRRHLLKSPGNPARLPAVLIDPVIGQGVQNSEVHLGRVLKLYDADLAAALQEEAGEFPGIGATPSEYGDTAAVQEPVQVTREVVRSAPTQAPTPSTPATAPTRATARGGAKPPAAVGPAAQVQPASAAVVAPTPTPAQPANGSVPPPPGMKPPARMPGA